MESEGENAERKEIIRSAPSNDSVFLKFVNGTTRIVSVYWIDFEGKPIFYTRLLPSKGMDINTFRSHAWIFRDTITGERYQVQGESILWARPYYIKIVRDRDEIVPARRSLQIHFPIRTLREYTLWYLMRRLRNISADMVQQLEVPRVLKDDLMDVLRKVIAFRTNATLPV